MFCTKCGNQIKDGFKFCPKCGTPVYVEKETTQSKVKSQVEEVKKKASSSIAINQDITPNPLLLEELDIDGVKKKAEQGDKTAILRQAFRYEMGIGVEKNLDKAEELYEKVGGKNVLFLLEDTYANCILPDSYYGLSVPENKKTNSSFYFKTLSFVKDLIIDYANKVNSAKLRNDVTEKELKDLKDEFVNKLLVVRDRYPEYLFINYDTDINEEKAIQIFDVIKNNSLKRYSLSCLPSLFYFSDYIDGNRIEIPNIFDLDFSSDTHRLYVNQKTPDDNFYSSAITQIVYNILLQLPVKKVHFTFCCNTKGDIGAITKKIDSSIYDIVCSDEDFVIYADKLYKRKRIVAKKYGVYQDYCEKNETIPIPYEIVVNLNPHFLNNAKEQIDIYESITFGKDVGVYYIEFVPYVYDELAYSKEFTLNSSKNEIYTCNPTYSGKHLIQSGIYWGTPADSKPMAVGTGFLVKAPLSGIITEIQVNVGDKIRVGDTLLLLEAMLMLNVIESEYEGIVTSIAVKQGQSVMEDDVLITIGFPQYSNSDLDICRFDKTKEKHYKLPILGYRPSNNDGIIKWTPIIENKTLFKACVDYINNEAQAKEEMKVRTLDFALVAESKYETDLSTMIIPVGEAEAKDADFRMDLVSHVHSFIIGQSGSGKSVFLHNIIGGAMLKYSPEDLQLYLLDFKLGGVEFNRYQGAKHVKALLVDNSDPQVTLEILRELMRSMTERGKMLRNAGAGTIAEYNKINADNRMPHVLLVADECHEMFKADDSIPRQVRNEISDIVIKIAKEGRNQGVHLIFATQTLSGTEISSEILNNVHNFFLLKCAQTDSERLVPNSSNITSELSTGQIYYHHVDEQVKFQAYYTDKEAAEKLMAAIVEKAKDHKSNGEFYFNGAQMFYLDESVKEQMLNVKGKSPVAFMGKAIDISQKDLFIKLNEDFSENVLLLGLNDQEQVTRTTMNLFVSLMMSAKLKHKDIAFKVIDCLNNEEGEVHELIFDLENEGLCEIIERRQRSKFFKDLAQGVLDGTAEETILLILGQDRFRELKMDMELEDGNSSKSSDDDDMMSISDDFFGGGSSSSTNVKTYKDALNVILEKGPDYGVHTLLQIEKASNLLFEDYITPKVVFQKFKHLVMLKSDETAGVTLHLNDDIRLEKLSSDWERLRAYYYAEESDSYTLFTPYMPSKSKEIINLLKTI